ncbi:hypothetical protein CGRA01v4_14789 [Colletotrichum graminicola]|nr:hypothetical protein CGRA01v4_14789 [Colletotrichum graminicola]
MPTTCRRMPQGRGCAYLRKGEEGGGGGLKSPAPEQVAAPVDQIAKARFCWMADR